MALPVRGMSRVGPARLSDGTTPSIAGPDDVGCLMAQKSRGTGNTKKPGKSLKEKRAAKHEKQDAKAAERKIRDR
jgi:hypothetical protein